MRISRLSWLLAIAVIAAIAQSPQDAQDLDWGQREEAYSMAIKMSKARYAPGDTITVFKYVRNCSDYPVSYFYSEPVIALQGVELYYAATPWEKRMKRELTLGQQSQLRRRLFASRFRSIKPGEITAWDVALNPPFDLSLPGVYHLRLFDVQRWGTSDRTYTLYSNEVTFAITEPK